MQLGFLAHLVFLLYIQQRKQCNIPPFVFLSKDGSLENGTNWQTLLWNSAKQRPEAQNWTSKLLSIYVEKSFAEHVFFLFKGILPETV